MEKSCKKAFETHFTDGIQAPVEVSSTKRQKLSDTESKPMFRSCKQAKQVEFGLDSPALDVVISDKFLEVVCKCEDCTKTFSRIKKLIHAMENIDAEQ